jgi:hypothetical protein
MANGTSAAAVGAHMPASLTLDDIAAMAVADEYGHRYEMSPEGVLSVMPPAGVEPAILASRLLVWFVSHDRDRRRHRRPRPRSHRVEPGAEDRGDLGHGGTAPGGRRDRLQGSEAMDHVTKRAEYAAARIARYWLVERDNANTVVRYELTGQDYVEVGRQPLAWLLNTNPTDHL